ncbi:hypothetical protein A1351_21385 [Methylosinus sp. R-45379]|nr:hypothetical protein A1351_21385 [Methylosinus sp. R-45379]
MQRAAESLPPNKIAVIPAADNKFFYISNQERFNEIARYKAIICNPIYNDVPARVFDALAVGAIPLVPYGLPDLSRCFDSSTQLALPIIPYIPDNIDSLRSALDAAIKAFDDGGLDGVKRRNRAAIDGHFLHHRLSSMLSELIALARVSC